MAKDTGKMNFATKAIHCGEEPNLLDGGYGDVCSPIHLSTTFARNVLEVPTAGYEYSRSLNPTRNALENKLAAVEGAKHALAFASGMAAETTLCLSLLKPGDHIVAFDDLYGGTRRLFSKTLTPHMGIECSFVDASDTSNVEAAMTGSTRIVWLESPTNPTLKLCDIEAICKIAHAKGALVVVDNTFASSYFQQPLALGADIVVHSMTKYMNGHSDSVGGALMMNDSALCEAIQFNQNSAGAILSPFDSYLVMRGMKTLALRMERHAANAQRIAEHLEASPKVERVFYPGLESHPQHELAKRQTSGHGGMLSFLINGGLSEAKLFLEAVEYFALAESLGGVESLIEHPALMTHASVPAEERAKIGVLDNLIRISVGIEHIDDLLADIEQALAKV